LKIWKNSALLAPYACHAEQSRGRLHAEAEAQTRTCFQRDRDRVIHSVAFRRLKHKTQVFVYHEGDHYRTRLTHTLEVAQIARSIARALRLDEDLTEALALAHDLGHPPFAHAGEEALAACMSPFGGFDHNAHTLRLVTSLERRYAEFDGLNLTWETLEGIAKHNGPIASDRRHASIEAYDAKHDLALDLYPSAEAQVAALSDDVAYNNHDIDDGLRADLFQIDDLRAVPLVGDLLRQVDDRYPNLEPRRLTHELVRRVITAMVDDLLAAGSDRLGALNAKAPDDIRSAKRPVVAFSDEFNRANLALKDFLFQNMYRHYKVNRASSRAKRLITELFDLFVCEPELLPDERRQMCDAAGSAVTAQVVCDFIAGMTDRYAMREHQRLFNLSSAI
jgi:dGTPase